MSDRFNIPSDWQGIFSQVVREIQTGLSRLESSVNTYTGGGSQTVPLEDEDISIPVDREPRRADTPQRASVYGGKKWEYKVVYVNFKGQISSEGEQILIGRGERRSSFVRRYLDEIGAEGWELAGVSPLGESENSYFIFKRPATGDAKPAPAPEKIPVVEEVDGETSEGGSTI